MTQGLKGKVAIVTGAAKGIGRAIALRLAKDGAAVIVNYSGSAKQAQEAVGLIEQGGSRAVAVQADVSKVGDVNRLFDTCFEKFGRLDILVNNAGMMFTKPVVEVGEEEFDRIFAVNVKGTFFCCQEAVKRVAEGGRIVNFSSSTTAMMLPGYAAYVATKGAVEQFSHILAKELGPKKITVTSCHRGRPTLSCSARARVKTRSSGSHRWRRWDGSANRRTLPTWWRCLPVKIPAGSPGRTFGPTAG
jgi:3-oxoacyl-[acyl-carrier protein] reductase